MQRFTSAATSINSKKLPAVYNKVLFAENETVLDYGCGRYIDHIRAFLPDDVTYLPYDKFNQTEGTNEDSLKRAWEVARSGGGTGRYMQQRSERH